MGKSGKRLPGKILREVLRPFKSLEKRIKSKAQRFVLKTVGSHPVPVSQPTASSDANASSASQLDPLLLAFLRSGQRSRLQNSDAVSAVRFSAIPVSSDRLIAWHPHAEFVYASTADHRSCALMAACRFDRSLTEKLTTTVVPGSCVYVLGDSDGFHALSLSELVGPQGTVVCLDDVTTGLGQTNFETNRCHNIVSPSSGPAEMRHAAPDLLVVRIEDDPHAALETMSRLMTEYPQMRILVHLSYGQRSKPETLRATLNSLARVSRAEWKTTQFGLQWQAPEADPLDAACHWEEPWLLIPEALPAQHSRAA